MTAIDARVNASYRDDVVVVIVNYNSGPHLMRCLESISRQRTQPRAVLVLDNASSDESMGGVREKFPHYEVVSNHANEGFAAGANRGLRFARAVGANFIAYLNPDAVADEGWLAELLAGAERNPASASLASWMQMASDPAIVDGLGDSYHVSGLAWRRRHGRRIRSEWLMDREVFGACAGAALFRVDAIEEVGGFDEYFFCYLEDVDLAFRLRLSGYSASLISAASVVHVGSASTGYRSDFSVYHGTRNLLWVYVKNMPSPGLWLTLPLHLIVQLLVLLKAVGRAQGRIALEAQIDSVKGLPEQIRKRRSVQSRRVVSFWTLLRAMSKSVLVRS